MQRKDKASFMVNVLDWILRRTTGLPGKSNPWIWSLLEQSCAMKCEPGVANSVSEVARRGQTL